MGEAIAAAFIATLIFMMGFFMGSDASQDRIQAEIVERGHAEWVSDSRGRTTFTWKEDLSE